MDDAGRRRKIRCIFSPANPGICTECFARGAQCVDQEKADPAIIVDQRKNLRERVARLESLIDTLLEEQEHRKGAPGEGLPLTPQSRDSDYAMNGGGHVRPMDGVLWSPMNDPQASLALQLAQGRYDLSLASIVELTQAQLNVTSAEIENLNAKYDYQIQFAALQFTIGLLR